MAPVCASSREEWLRRVRADGASFSDAPEALQADREVALAAVEADWRALEHAAAALRNDRELVLAAVRQRGGGQALEFASQRLRGDREIVMTAVEDDFTALQHAADALRADRDVVVAAVREDGLMLEYAAESLLRDRDLALLAIGQDWRAMQFLPEDMRADWGLVMAAVKKSGMALQFAAPKLRADRQLVLAALEDQPSSMQFVAPVLLADRSFVVSAVERAGLPLACVSEGLREDRAVLSAAEGSRRLFESAESRRAEEEASRYGKLEAALRRQKELAEKLEQQRTPADLHGTYVDRGWVSIVTLNRRDFVEVGTKIEASLSYSFVRGPKSRRLPPVGSVAVEKLLGTWQNHTFVGHGVSSDAFWLAPAPRIRVEFNGDRCDWCRITVGEASCELLPLRPSAAGGNKVPEGAAEADTATDMQEAAATAGLDEDEEAIRLDFLEVASELSEEDLRKFVGRHIASELEAVRALPQEQRARAFRLLCFQWHPDKCPAAVGLATEVFQQLQAQKDALLLGA